MSGFFIVRYDVAEPLPLTDTTCIPEAFMLVEMLTRALRFLERGAFGASPTYFDDITQRHIYSGDNEIVEALAPITALGMNRNGFAVEVQAGEVSIIPHSDAVIVSKSGLSAKEAPAAIIKPSKSKQTASKNSCSCYFYKNINSFIANFFLKTVYNF